MRSRSSSMDLGLVAMALGEARQTPSQPESIDMRVDDVARLNALLSNPSTSLQGQHDSGQQAQTDSLLPANPEISSDDLTRVALAITRMWTGNGSQSLREVRAQLPDEVLPSTWLRLFEQGGVLQIEVTCGASEECQWLAQELNGLAARLGLRLKRPLLLRLFDALGRQCGASLWPTSEAA